MILPRLRRATAAVVAAFMLATIGCGSDDDGGESGLDSQPNSTSSVEDEATSATTAVVQSDVVTIPLTNESAYRYEARFRITGLTESIERAAPGLKRLSLEGSAELVNATAGRIAPALEFQIFVAIPSPGCPNGLTCQEGFRILPFNLAPTAFEVPAGGSTEYVAATGGVYDQSVSEDVQTDAFYWGLRLLGAADNDAITGGWHPVGNPDFPAPTFSRRDFTGS